MRKTKKRNARIVGSFSLIYRLNNKTYEYTNYDFLELKNAENTSIKIDTKPRLLENGKLTTFENVILPNRILALANTITDRYYTEIVNFEAYTYLGVRANANTARTSSFINRTIDLLYEMLPVKNVLSDIEVALDFLGYDKSLVISYYPRYKPIFFKGNLTEDTFDKFFTRFWEYTKRDRQNPPWSNGVYKKLKKENPEITAKLTKLCNKIHGLLQYEYESSRTQYFDVDVFETIFSLTELRHLQILHSLDLISYPVIGLYKKEQYLQIESTSSGEYHFISSFIGLLARITDNSLILIDEPENSLHPNWQMKYITFLKTIFKKYKSCHFLLTSHSHFLVSDLPSESSTIVGLRKEDGVKAELIKTNTYAWSAEEILLKIFKVSSSRNYYLTDKLEQIFSLIGKEPSKAVLNEIKIRVEELKKIDFSGLNHEDPLKDVVQTLFKKFENA